MTAATRLDATFAALADPTRRAIIARLARGSFLDVRRQNFIRAARARGLPEWRVVVFHALKPTLVPLVSYLAPAVAGVMTGSIVIEAIFGIPGTGRDFILAIGNRDHSTVIYSCRAVQDMMDTDMIFKDTVAELEKKIKMSLNS